MVRKAVDPAKLADIDEALRGLFSVLQNQPLPSRLLSLIDQLDEGDVEQRSNIAGHGR
jgi:hypothetical protein